MLNWMDNVSQMSCPENLPVFLLLLLVFLRTESQENALQELYMARNNQMVFLLQLVIFIEQPSKLFYLKSTSIFTHHRENKYP